MDEIEARYGALIEVTGPDADNEIRIAVQDDRAERNERWAAAYLTGDQTVALIEILRSRLPIEVRP